MLQRELNDDDDQNDDDGDDDYDYDYDDDGYLLGYDVVKFR
jgi:hypothetical protein